ncbi:MAG: MMPL family transporter [Bacteroidales bacterium]|nr:MMPL family transporter [Bacteroidales bacterium]
MFKKLLTKPYRYFLIIIPILIFLGFLIPLRNIRINPDMTRYLPQETESKLNLEKIEEIFGHNDPIIVIFEADDIIEKKSLEKISAIHDSLTESAIISDVMSIFNTKNIRGEDGFMLVDPAIKDIPDDKAQKEELRKEIKNNPLAYKLFVSEDFRYSVMIINPEKGYSDSEIIKTTKNIVNSIWGNEKYYMSGMLYLREEIQQKAMRDLVILMPIALLVMIIFLYFSFREKRGVILPMLVVIISTGVSMGLMPLLGYEFSIIAVLIPILMISVANNYGVHIVSKYQELNATNPNANMDQIVSQSMKSVANPVILTGLTTIAGVLGLIVHIMLPAKQTGIVCSIGIGLALILSLYFLPAILIGMKKGKVNRSFKEKSKTYIDKLLLKTAKITITKPKLVIIIFTIAFVISLLGIFRLNVSINNEKMMAKSHDIRKSTDIVNKHFGGTKYISVLFEGDIKDPEVVNEMDELEQLLKSKEQTGSVTSLSSIIKIMSKALNDKSDAAYDQIPDSREAIAQYIEFYNMSGNPEDFEKFVDFNYTKAIVNVQFKAENIKEYNSILREIQRFCDNSKYAKYQAGISIVEKDMAMSIIKGQIYSLALAMITIILLLWIIFKSFRTGLLGTVPLIFTLSCNFGLMGWAGIELDIATSLLSSIALGIGIDYTIHLFWRIKSEIENGKNMSEAITICLTTTGRGIAINAISVILGFSVLFLSGILILKTFALLIIFSLLLCLICALILVPSILKLKPEIIVKNIKLNK